MATESNVPKSLAHRLAQRSELTIAITVGLLSTIAFYFSAHPVQSHFDYTCRVAGALLSGQLGLDAQPPPWLNEFVPLSGHWYSVFPLGAVLVNFPAALLQKLGVVRDSPARETAAVIAGAAVFFFYRLSAVRADLTVVRRILLSLAPVFATWMWCNLGMAGAWQMALGFAVLGEVAALYYTVVARRPFIAGFWMAIAIGNRTELVLLVPIFLWLLIQSDWREWRRHVPVVARFIAAPLALLILTAVYNWGRFGSPTDFGYARIPGVLNEPWYRQGVFSLGAVRWNIYEMLFRGMIDMQRFPYLRPHAFGCSIFLASPLLFLLFRDGGMHVRVCWMAVAIITLLLWTHGNAGGWQFSYRYAMTLLPWFFLILLENGDRRMRSNETVLLCVSLLINALATYEFLWTDLVQP